MAKQKTIVGRHINGITLNPLEWLLDDDGNIMYFDSEADAKDFLIRNGIPDDELEYFVFRQSVGTCKRCGSPLFESRIGGYAYECLICDEDFYAFEQESTQTIVGMPRENFARKVFNLRHSDASIEFYCEYNKEDDEGTGAHKIQVIRFADSDMVIANYYGGGSPFCCDITGEADSGMLEEHLSKWLNEHDFGNMIWVEL